MDDLAESSLFLLASRNAIITLSRLMPELYEPLDIIISVQQVGVNDREA